MLTRLILRLPWFLSAPTLIAGAALIAAAVSIVGGPYFERTYRDDADPLAGLNLPPAVPAVSAASGETEGTASSAQTATSTSAASDAVAATPPATSASVLPAAAPTTPPVVAVPPAAQPVAAATPAAAAAVAGAPPTTAAPAAVASAPPAAAPAAAPAAPAASNSGAPGVLAQGRLLDGDPGHPASGRVRLIRAPDGALVLRLEEFSIVNGPDVYVVLSTDPNRGRDSAVAGDALNLGRSRATNGNVNYAIPAGTDLAPFRSVILYCRAFHVVMGAATLEATP